MSDNTENFLPNCQWQLWSRCGYITKMNSQGTGTQAQGTVTSFSTTNNNPTFSVGMAGSTQQLKVGDLFYLSNSSFWGWAGVGYVAKTTAVRVNALTTNSTFNATGHFGGVSPGTSAALTATPICPGDSAGTGTRLADGWQKTTALAVWADDFSSNACPGAIRTLGARMTSTTAQKVYWRVPANQMIKYKGRDVTFGSLVWQKAQGGAGTWRLYMWDDVNGYSYSSNGTGSGYSGGSYGGFEFLNVSATISPNATDMYIGYEFTGTTNDIYYCALPTAVLDTSIAIDNCRQNPMDLIIPDNIWTAPILSPLAMDFPGGGATYGSYWGFSGQDIEAMSMGIVHKSVAAIQTTLGFFCATGSRLFGSASRLNYSLIYGPEAYSNVGSVENVVEDWLHLADDGTFALYTGNASLTIAGAQFKFGMVQLSHPSSAN